MPRNVTALGSELSSADQIPVSLVRLEIPGDERRFHDLDVPLYLDPTTNAVSMTPGAGLLEFLPAAGLEVPQIELTAELPLGDVTLTLSNISEDWFAVIAAGAYREASATLWQGNIGLPAGTAPQLATFVGAVTTFVGAISHIEANRQTTTIRLRPPDPFTMPFPHRTYSPEDFPHAPIPGTVIRWGYTEKEI